MNGAPSADLLAQAVALGQLIDYQPAAVVSRTLIKRPTGTVTLFAFDQAQELSEHTSPFDAMVYVLEGELDLTIAGTPFHLAGGQMIIMPAHQPHGLKAPRPCKMLLVMIRS